MKKSILLFGAILLTITALGFIKWEVKNADKKSITAKSTAIKLDPSLPFYIPRPTNLYYDLGARFGSIKKTTASKATSVRDFFTAYDQEHITAVHNTNLIVIKNDKHSQIQFQGKGEKLSEAQLNFLRSCDYSTNLKLSIRCKAKGPFNQKEEWAEYTPHFSIVPEQQASYSLGKDAFIEYLREGNKKNAFDIDNKKLGFSKLSFRVNVDGSISNVNLDRSTGYEKIDNGVIELFKNAPGKWLPAQTADGKKVSQELVISFGMGGC